MTDRPEPRWNQLWIPRVGRAKSKLVTHVSPTTIHAIAYPPGMSGRRYPPAPTAFSRRGLMAWCDTYQALPVNPPAFDRPQRGSRTVLGEKCLADQIATRWIRADHDDRQNDF